MATNPTEYLPLRPVEFDILLSLAPGPCHGYGILQILEDRDGPGAVPDIVTLYRALRRMHGQTLVEPLGDPEATRQARNRTLADTARPAGPTLPTRLPRLVRDRDPGRGRERSDPQSTGSLAG